MEEMIEEWDLEEPADPSTSTGTRAVYGRATTRRKRESAKLITDVKQEPDDDVVTDAASEADGEVVLEQSEEEDEDSDSDDSDEGTYFIDQTGNYYYQATPDSEPVLTTPPKGKYIPEYEGDSELHRFKESDR